MLPNVISCCFGRPVVPDVEIDQRHVRALRRVGQLEDAALVPQRALDHLVEVARQRVALRAGQPRVDRDDRRAEQQRAVQRLDERQPGVERQPDALPVAHAADVQGARRADGAQQQFAIGDRFVRRRDGDAVRPAPCGAREPVPEVHLRAKG